MEVNLVDTLKQINTEFEDYSRVCSHYLYTQNQNTICTFKIRVKKPVQQFTQVTYCSSPKAFYSFPSKYNCLTEHTSFQNEPDKLLEGDQFMWFLLLKLLTTKVLELEVMFKQLARLLQKDQNFLMNYSASLLKKYSTQTKSTSLFQQVFCRKCYKFWCKSHPKRVQQKHSKNQLQDNSFGDYYSRFSKTEWWASKHSVQESGLWAKSFLCKDFLNCAHSTTAPPKYPLVASVFVQKKVLNPCFMSLFLGESCKSLSYFLNQSFVLEVVPPVKKLPPSDTSRHPKLLVNTFAVHCSCKQKCTPENGCVCLAGPFKSDFPKCCDKFCSCTLFCKVKFLGCNCKMGKCTSDSCICRANSRECDPDLCLMCCCLGSLTREFQDLPSSLLCKNTFLQKDHKRRTAVGLSQIPKAGLGLFSLERINPREPITVYCGEYICKSEANVRGAQYDRLERSYLFSLDTDFTVDSTLMGNKMRFVNHRSHQEENCECTVWKTAFGTYVVLSATKNISPGEELTFNYNYTEETKFRWYIEYELGFSGN